MIKVCHISTAHRTTDNRIFHKECVTLASVGYDVILIARGESGIKSGVRIISFPNLSRTKRLLYGRYIALKLALEIDADIYHLHDPDLLLIARKLKQKGKKVIFDSHENVAAQILCKSYIPKIIRHLISKGYGVYEKHIISLIDGAIVVTPSQLPMFEKYQNNIQLVTNYPLVDDVFVQNVGKKTQQTSFQICFAGGISPQWSQEIILEAICGLNDVHYTIAGLVDQGYLEKLQKNIAWDNKVSFLGFVSKEQVADIYNNSSCGIALLRHDTQVGIEGTLGNTKLFEYMKFGLPVICSDLILWKEIVDKYDCGIAVNPTDVNAIRDAIMLLKDNSEVARQYGINGQTAFKNVFNWDTQVPMLLKVYENIINQSEQAKL